MAMLAVLAVLAVLSCRGANVVLFIDVVCILIKGFEMTKNLLYIRIRET